MRSLVIISILAIATAAHGQPAGSAAAGSAAPAPTPTPPPAAAPAPDASAARQACTTAMNADPTFAAEIVKVADQRAQTQRDADTLKTHQDAVAHVEKNEKHVIYAYAAMWIIAAGFVLFLWRRQQVLKVEIAHLRRDLESAASETGSKEAKS